MIKINGKRYNSVAQQVNGNQTITIIDGKITINGKLVDTGNDKEIYIHIDGPVDKLRVDSCEEISIKGDVGDVNTQSGNVNIIGDVVRNVKTMSGNVDCQDVIGNVNTMSGNIKKNK